MNVPVLFNPLSWDDWQAWFDAHAMGVILIVVSLFVIWWIYKVLVVRVLEKSARHAGRLRPGEDPVSVERRVQTMASTLKWIGGIFISFVGVGLVLSQLGLNVAALVAGVGVVGIALGFGAQALVRDIINGLFILTEDQYRVGDMVQVSGVTGEVIDLNPRRTVVRDEDGYVHIVPNGAIVVATNMSKEFNRVNFTVHVEDGEDVDRVSAIINEVGAEVARAHPDQILEPAKVLRVETSADGGMDLRVTGQVRAGSHDEASSLLSVAIKRRLGAEGVKSRSDQGTHGGPATSGVAAGGAGPQPGIGLLPRPGSARPPDGGSGPV